jgi:hypothetical protein
MKPHSLKISQSPCQPRVDYMLELLAAMANVRTLTQDAPSAAATPTSIKWPFEANIPDNEIIHVIAETAAVTRAVMNSEFDTLSIAPPEM